MAKIRCGYCGKEYDESYGGALENGSPACPECVADEEAEEERKRRKEAEKAKNTPQEQKGDEKYEKGCGLYAGGIIMRCSLLV